MRRPPTGVGRASVRRSRERRSPTRATVDIDGRAGWLALDDERRDGVGRHARAWQSTSRKRRTLAVARASPAIMSQAHHARGAHAGGSKTTVKGSCIGDLLLERLLATPD
jgi:hypothetical protein